MSTKRHIVCETPPPCGPRRRPRAIANVVSVALFLPTSYQLANAQIRNYK